MWSYSGARRGETLTPIDEATLVARLTCRDDPEDWRSAWELLVREHGGRVYGLALRMLRDALDAEDATQLVWERVLRGLRRFRGESALSTWLYRITMNVCLTRLENRAEPRRAAAEDETLAVLCDAAPDPERRAMSREMRAAIERALGSLDPAFRSVLLLREVEGLSYDDIARVLGIPVNTVRTRLFRARTALQAALEAWRS